MLQDKTVEVDGTNSYTWEAELIWKVYKTKTIILALWLEAKWASR